MATNAIETAQQENGSRHWFESVIENNKEPTDKDMVSIYPGYNPDWKSTYRKQVIGVKDKRRLEIARKKGTWKK